MGSMQVNVDGTNLDNGSWRLLEDKYGDSIGDDDVRVLACMFTIEADDPDTLEVRKLATEQAFIKANPRVWFTLDDAGATGAYFGDISPNDGTHTRVRCTIDWTGSREQTGHSLIGILYVKADVYIPMAGGATGSGQVNYTGLKGTLKRSVTYNQGRVESRAVLATFVTTFDDDANGPYTIASVANSGGKAVFTFSTDPPAFVAGMRLKVTASTTVNGSGYAGVHLVTAISVAGKTVTTDTAYDGSETGTAYVGQLTTGAANYAAAKSSLFTTHLGVEADGSRDGTTGLVLVTEKQEADDANENTVTVLLQSEWSETELSSVNNADRGLDVVVDELEPDQWDHRAGGTAPRLYEVKASAYFDRALLSSGNLKLHQLWRDTMKATVEARVQAETGAGQLRMLRGLRISSNVKTSRLSVAVVYQARNTTTIDAELSEDSRQDDDAIHYKLTNGKDYEQRIGGLPPKIITKTLRHVGWAKKNMDIPTPPGDGQGSSYRAGPVSESYAEKTLPGGDVIYIQTKSVAFLRRQYVDGNRGVTLL